MLSSCRGQRVLGTVEKILQELARHRVGQPRFADQLGFGSLSAGHNPPPSLSL